MSNKEAGVEEVETIGVHDIEKGFFVVWSRGDETPVKVSGDFFGCTIQGNDNSFSYSDILRMLKEGVLTKVCNPAKIG